MGAVKSVRMNCGLPASRSLWGSRTVLFLCGRSPDHAIVTITAIKRVRNNGNLNLNLAAIDIIGLVAYKSKVSFRRKVMV